MQEAPGRMRAATWIQICRKRSSQVLILTISGFLPQMSIRRIKTRAEGSSIKVMAMKLVVAM